MGFIELNTLKEKEYFPGFRGRMVHTDNMTLAYWNIAEGCDLPEHSHPHEQVVNVMDGTLELVVDGQSHILKNGTVFVIPSNVKHSGKAHTFCRVLDVFNPVREN